MSDVSVLRQNPAPLPDNAFRSTVSGSRDPDISVDVGMVLTTDPDNSLPNGTVFFASSDTQQNALAAGLAASATEAGKAITIQYRGPMSLPTERWDRVTGQSGGLTPGAIYYVSETEGMLTTLDTGVWLTYVGYALSPTTMLINIQPPIDQS